MKRVFKNLRGEGKLTAENMEAAARDSRGRSGIRIM
jgi:hypothetical protein